MLVTLGTNRGRGEERYRDDRRVVPDLEEIDEREAHRFLAELLSNLNPEGEYDARYPEDYAMEMPRSGERFRGTENLRAMQEAYPTASPADRPVAPGAGKGGVVGRRGGRRLGRGEGAGGDADLRAAGRSMCERLPAFRAAAAPSSA